MKSILVHIAMDFTSKFSPTASISRYSPTASALAKKCSRVYPAELGGAFNIKIDEVIAASRALGLFIRMIPGTDDAQIAISAEQFNQWSNSSVFRDDFVCLHGFAPYTFLIDYPSVEPKTKVCCPRCNNGQEQPSETEVDQARHFLNGETAAPTPGAGALILAARDLGFDVTCSLNGKFQISRSNKPHEKSAQRLAVDK